MTEEVLVGVVVAMACAFSLQALAGLRVSRSLDAIARQLSRIGRVSGLATGTYTRDTDRTDGLPPAHVAAHAASPTETRDGTEEIRRVLAEAERVRDEEVGEVITRPDPESRE